MLGTVLAIVFAVLVTVVIVTFALVLTMAVVDDDETAERMFLAQNVAILIGAATVLIGLLSVFILA